MDEPNKKRPRGPQANLAQAKEDLASGTSQVLQKIEELERVCNLPGNDAACLRALDGVDTKDAPRAVRKRIGAARNHLRRKANPPKPRAAKVSSTSLNNNDDEE